MKPSSSPLFAMLLSSSMLVGCASTGSTPAGASAEAPAAKTTTTEQAPAPASKAPAADPECD